MKKVLFTGGTGFLGRNLVPELKGIYDLYAPSRSELDLRNYEALKAYLMTHKFDVIIHAAIPNLLSNESDQKGSVLMNSLLPFMNLYNLQDYYGRLLYFGSGAEYDKSLPICSVTEEEFGRRVPINEYGLAKFTMNSLCRKSKKLYNLRIFGCYGPTDADFKLITYAIRCCLKGEQIVLNQNCLFDYMYVKDILPILNYFIYNNPEYHDYNICTGIKTDIEKICRQICALMGCPDNIITKKPGLNNEYSGDNRRIKHEIPSLVFTDLLSGINLQIEQERKDFYNEKASC